MPSHPVGPPEGAGSRAGSFATVLGTLPLYPLAVAALFRSLADKKYQQLIESGSWPRWLSDSRKLVFHDRHTIDLIDTGSRSVREIYSTAFREIEDNASLGIPRADLRVYFSLTATEADVWLMSAQ